LLPGLKAALLIQFTFYGRQPIICGEVVDFTCSAEDLFFVTNSGLLLPDDLPLTLLHAHVTMQAKLINDSLFIVLNLRALTI
jgi:hypothetical protein